MILVCTSTIEIPKMHESESDDAASISRPLNIRTNSFSACVADGVAAGYESGLFARLLCRFFRKQRKHTLPSRDSIELACRTYKAERSDPGAAWYSQRRAGRGAGATFAGLRIHSNGTLAYGLCGDSVLFTATSCNQDAEVRVHSDLDQGQFTQFPEQFSTAEWCPRRTKEGLVPWRDRIFFVLATDGLAKWMVNRMDSGENPIDRVRSMTNACSAADLVCRIERMPESQMLRSDDVAAIWGVAMND